MKTLQYCTRVALLLATFFHVVSCTKTKDLPIETIKPVLSVEQCEGLCSKINDGFEVINTLTRALREGDRIVSITPEESNASALSFLSGAVANVYNVRYFPFIGLSLDESGELCWVIVDNCSKEDLGKIIDKKTTKARWDDDWVREDCVEDLYLSYGEKVPVKGEIRVEFDEMSRAFLLYEGQKLLHKYNDRDDFPLPFTYSSGESRNIRFFVEKDDCVYFKLLDGKVLSIPKAGYEYETAVEVSVETAGTLAAVLKKYTYSHIRKLKITGPLNDEDFAALGDLNSLEYLDISDVPLYTLMTACSKPLNKIKILICPKTLVGIPTGFFMENDTLVDIQMFDDIRTIGDRAFCSCSALRCIAIPASCERIEKAAFLGCKALERVTFEPHSQLKSIGGGHDSAYLQHYEGAFGGCISLKSIIIPASCEEIEACAFKGCTSLESVSFEPVSRLMAIRGGGTENSKIPAYYGTFSDCTSLKSIRIPSSCQVIEDSAFKNCITLESVTFEDDSHVEEIAGASYGDHGAYIDAQGAFCGCSSLKSITIPATCQRIGDAAFKGCVALEKVSFEPNSQLSAIEGDRKSRGYSYSGAFADCVSLKSIVIPAHCSTIGISAFKNCTSLESVVFEQGSRLTIISGGFASDGSNYYGVFSDCTSLESINIPASCEKIEASAFKNCNVLRSVTFEKGSHLKTIEGGYYFDKSSLVFRSYGAFSDCTSLTAIEIPSTVETIGAATFRNCASLEAVSFDTDNRIDAFPGEVVEYASHYPISGNFDYKSQGVAANGDVMYFGYYSSGVFSNCKALKSIKIPSSVQAIGDACFLSCFSMVDFSLEENSSLVSIGVMALANCCALSSVDMRYGTRLAEIGCNAFIDDDRISIFQIGAVVPPSCQTDTFGNVGEYSVLKVPSGSEDAYKAASGWGEFYKIIANE